MAAPGIPDRSAAGSAGDGLRSHGQWLLLFRVASAVVILLGGAAIHLRQTGTIRVAPLAFFYGALVATFVMSLVVAALMRARAGIDAALVGYSQLAVDVVMTTLLVYSTGAQDSVITFLFPLNTLYAAALISPGAGYGSALGGALSFGGLVVMHGMGWIQRVDDPGTPFDREAVSVVMTTAGANFLVAMLGGQLSEQLRSSGERLLRVRKDLRVLQSLQSAMVQSISSGLLSVSADDRVQLINPAAQRLLGFSEGEAVGRTLQELLPTLPPVKDQRGPGEMQYRHPDGGVRSISYSVSELQGADEQPGNVVILQDVTAQRELEKAMQRSQQLATVGQFAAGLAHELRNPLGSMIGCVELLQKGANRGGDEDRLLRIVHREAERLERLVRSFLHYARPSDPQLVPVDVDELLASVAEEMARDSTLGAPVRVDGTCGLKVLADPGQLRQVLLNLLRNACQVSPPGAEVLLRGEPSLLLGESRERDDPAGPKASVRITVTDNGPGVPQDVERFLFEPFFSTMVGGTGLGLAIVHRIVESHGGSVGLEAAGGPGATFFVNLPQPQDLRRAAVPAPEVNGPSPDGEC